MSMTRMISRITDSTLQTYKKSSISDREAKHILTAKSTSLQKKRLIKRYKDWLELIGYTTTKPSTEWQGYHYVDLILKRVIPSSPAVYKACERFVWELDNQGTEHFPYFWDEDKALKRVKYYEKWFTVNVGGKREPFIMQPNQQFRLCQTVGWVEMGIDGGVTDNPGKRMYLDIMGRGNGKTTEKVPLYTEQMFTAGDQRLQLLFLAGTDIGSKQPWGEVKDMISKARPAISNRFKVLTGEIRLLEPQSKRDIRQNVKAKEQGSVIFKSTQSADSSHGGATKFVLYDEVHTYKSSEILKTIEQSFTKSENPIAMYTSTRSSGWSSVLEDKISEGMDALDGYKDNPSYHKSFYFLAYLDDVSDMSNFNNWVKANPNIMFQKIEELMDIYISHLNEPNSQEAFDMYTQMFNYPDTAAATAYIPTESLDGNTQKVDPDKYVGEEAYLGIDLAGIDDFSYVTAMVPIVDNNVEKIFVEGRGFVTESNYKDKTTGQQVNFKDMDVWKDKGILEIMSDHERNEEQVYDYIKYLIGKYKVKRIGIDKYQSDYIRIRLEQDGYGDLITLVAQTRTVLDAPLKELREVFISRNVIYNEDPLLYYFFRNSQLIKGGRVGSSDGQWSISKPLASKTSTVRPKIDGMAALTDAYSVFLDDRGFAGKKLDSGDDIQGLVSQYEAYKNLRDERRRKRREVGKVW